METLKIGSVIVFPTSGNIFTVVGFDVIVLADGVHKTTVYFVDQGGKRISHNLSKVADALKKGYWQVVQ